MDSLDPSAVKHFVWHTAAHGADGRCYDTTVGQIDQWHRDRGFAMIGYHYVVYRDGSVHVGRPLDRVGAHVEGINHKSVGICFAGHGDICPLTPAQMKIGVALTVRLLNEFGLRDDFLAGAEVGLTVMGHREVNRLVSAGKARKRTDKSCPGLKVDMNGVRALVRSALDLPPARKLLESLRAVYSAAAELKLPEDSLRHLNAFRRSVDEIF